jgi:hypothetical protein
MLVATEPSCKVVLEVQAVEVDIMEAVVVEVVTPIRHGLVVEVHLTHPY